VDGEKYQVNYYYHAILKIIDLLGSGEWSDEEKIPQALGLFYLGNIPGDVEAALNALFSFIGKGSYQTNYRRGQGNNKILYDYQKDQQLIWASMAQTYGLDWTSRRLHWWEFKAAFDNLPEDTPIKNVIRIRSTKIKTKMSSEEKQQLLELKEIYALEGGAGAPQMTAQELEKQLLKGGG
jgi:hypothetical protein